MQQSQLIVLEVKNLKYQHLKQGFWCKITIQIYACVLCIHNGFFIVKK